MLLNLLAALQDGETARTALEYAAREAAAGDLVNFVGGATVIIAAPLLVIILILILI